MILTTSRTIVGILFALATLPGTLELFFLTLASLFWKQRPLRNDSPAVHMAVVIPAHNEENSIRPCLKSLAACHTGRHHGEPVVVADNCTDHTARIATEMGARVLIRTHETERGKGYALAYAFDELMKESFDAFIVLDADSMVEPNFIERFASHFSTGGDAAQCRYLPASPESSLRSRLMHLALLAFHVTRPRGRSRLGFSSGIFGNGFGLSRHALETVPYHTGSIAEDLEYHIALVKHDFNVAFEDLTTVRSLFPGDEAASSVQRSRWEGGRFRLMATCVPSLVSDIFHGKRAVLEVLFDLLTLPLGFHVALIVLTGVVSAGPVRFYAFFASGVVAFHVITTIISAGSRHDLIALLAAPFYVLWKIVRLPLILNASKKDARWIRTPRHEKKEEKTP